MRWRNPPALLPERQHDSLGEDTPRFDTHGNLDHESESVTKLTLFEGQG